MERDFCAGTPGETSRGYTLSEAEAILDELKQVQRSLCEGEKEKAELMQSLARIKDDLTRLSASSNCLNSTNGAVGASGSVGCDTSPHASTLSLLNGEFLLPKIYFTLKRRTFLCG